MTFKKSVREIRVGSIKAAIWDNQTASGLRHNVMLSRLYKEDDQWKDSTSFGQDDLLVLAKVADLAHSWICDRNQNPDQEEKDGALPAADAIIVAMQNRSVDVTDAR